MLSNTQLKILASFFPKLEEKTSKQIEIATGLSHEPTFRILKSLVKSKYLKERKVGKTNVYRFVFSDDTYLVYTYFTTKKINKFREKHSLLYKRLKEFINLIKANSVILFGSYAKGTETKESDTDILVVSNEKNIEGIASTFKTKYNLAIKPVIVKVEDFENIQKENPTFYNDLIEFGIVLDGSEFFFKKVYKNGKIA